MDTSPDNESDHLQLHFSPTIQADGSSLTSKSYSTVIEHLFFVYFLHSKEEIMIYNQQPGSTTDLVKETG